MAPPPVSGIFRLKQNEEDLSLWSADIKAGDDIDLLSIGGLSMVISLPEGLSIEAISLGATIDAEAWQINAGESSVDLFTLVGASIDVNQEAYKNIFNIGMSDITSITEIDVTATTPGGGEIAWDIQIQSAMAEIGCMDVNACNYNSDAIIPCDDCCIYAEPCYDCDGIWIGGDGCGDEPIVPPGEDCPSAPIWNNTYITEIYEDCDECNKICYKIVDCIDPEGYPIIATSDPAFAIYVGHTIKYIVPGTEEERCGIVYEYICRKEDYELYGEIDVINCFDDCEECLYTPPEPEKDFAQRSVYPGYNTPACRIEVYDKTMCQWSEALYQDMATKRYGIEFCCDPAEQKWHIKKELLALASIYDPELCETKCERNFIAEPCCTGIENPEWLLPNGELTDLTPEGPVANCEEFLNTLHQCGEQFRECVHGVDDPLVCMEAISVQTKGCCQRVIQWKYCVRDQYIWFVQDENNNFTIYLITCPPTGPCSIFTAEECCSEYLIELVAGETGILTVIAGVVIEYGLDPNLIMEPYYEDGNCLLPCITQTEIVEMPASTSIGTVIKDTKGDCYTLIELTDNETTITWLETFATCAKCDELPPEPPVECTCVLVRTLNTDPEGLYAVTFGDCDGSEVIDHLGPLEYKEFCVDTSLPYDFGSPELIISTFTGILCCEDVELECCFEIKVRNDNSIDVAEFTYLPCGAKEITTITLLLGEQADICIDLCNYQIQPQVGILILWNDLNIPC